jgi:uroporphyrinogen-III synthase
LLLTRPEGSNADFAADFPAALARRLTFVDCPLIAITPVPADVAIEDAAVAIFTSSNGVRFAPPALGRRAFCVGESTTRTARDAGWQAVFAGQNAEGLIAHVAAQRPEGRLWHFSGVNVRGGVVEALCAAGLDARRVVVYDQPLLPLPDTAQEVLTRGGPVIVPLFSPRAATHFAAICPLALGVYLVALSPAVSEAALKIADFETVTASEPTAGSLIGSVEKLVGSLRLG